MNIQSSYIFIKEMDSNLTKDKDGNLHIVLGNNIYSRIDKILPNMTRISASVFHYNTEYSCETQLNGISCKVSVKISTVVKTTFVDIAVSAKTIAQAVKAMEYIQAQLLTKELAKEYIYIISYDAISEYFCNQTFPKLNMLERNLRKLLFNTYIVQFGKDYYQVTINEEIQKKAKERVSNAGGRKLKEVRRIQEFFYSLEYGDVEVMLFTPGWTRLEEESYAKLLEENSDLTKLSDEELRKAITLIRPRSDWERFFSGKILVDGIEEDIRRLRIFRNSVAHVKFFSREDYSECSKLIKSLNASILEAIKITEETDFAEKNREALYNSVAEVLEKVNTFTKWVGEKSMRTVQALAPFFEKIGKVVVAIEKDDVLKNRMLKECNEVMPVEVDGEDYLEEDQPEEIVN